MEAWEAASGGQLKLERTADRGKAHVRLFWAGARHGVYGETRPIVVDGVRGAEVYVLPATGLEGESDDLMRDAVVYLTCLHEAGHALGLGHTAAFSDIMYSFRYGGNIPEYFARYRRQLTEREDIHHHPGMSADDRRRLHEIWSAPRK
jgi:hypothetical protein